MRLGSKIGLLTALYLAQGLPFGFFTQALPVMLRRQGVSLEAIGLSSLLALPWALKFAWAPLADRHYSARLGRRRSWILPLQGAAVALALAIALLDPVRQLPLLLTAVLLTNLVAATQDIATDGLAVELLGPAERGLGNGVQVAGYRVGMVIGGGLLLVVFDQLGWAMSFVGMALLLALASLPIARYREPDVGGVALADSTSRAPRHQSLLQMLLAFGRRPGARAWLVAIMAYKAGGALAGAMVRPMLVDLGLGLAEIGWVVGLVGSAAGLAGALAGGAWVGRLGRRRALIAFGLAEAVAVALFVLPLVMPLGLWGLGVLSGVEHFVGGMATAALFTTMMDACAPERGATEYTLQASAVVIATGTLSAVAGFVAAGVGYGATFVIGAVGCALGVWLIAGNAWLDEVDAART